MRARLIVLGAGRLSS